MKNAMESSINCSLTHAFCPFNLLIWRDVSCGDNYVHGVCLPPPHPAAHLAVQQHRKRKAMVLTGRPCGAKALNFVIPVMAAPRRAVSDGLSYLESSPFVVYAFNVKKNKPQRVAF